MAKDEKGGEYNVYDTYYNSGYYTPGVESAEFGLAAAEYQQWLQQQDEDTASRKEAMYKGGSMVAGGVKLWDITQQRTATKMVQGGEDIAEVGGAKIDQFEWDFGPDRGWLPEGFGPGGKSPKLGKVGGAVKDYFKPASSRVKETAEFTQYRGDVAAESTEAINQAPSISDLDTKEITGFGQGRIKHEYRGGKDYLGNVQKVESPKNIYESSEGLYSTEIPDYPPTKIGTTNIPLDESKIGTATAKSTFVESGSDYSSYQLGPDNQILPEFTPSGGPIPEGFDDVYNVDLPMPDESFSRGLIDDASNEVSELWNVEQNTTALEALKKEAGPFVSEIPSLEGADEALSESINLAESIGSPLSEGVLAAESSAMAGLAVTDEINTVSQLYQGPPSLDAAGDLITAGGDVVGAGSEAAGEIAAGAGEKAGSALGTAGKIAGGAAAVYGAYNLATNWESMSDVDKALGSASTALGAAALIPSPFSPILGLAALGVGILDMFWD